MDKFIVNQLKTDPIMNKVIASVGDCLIGKKEQSIFSYLIGLIIGQKIRFSSARKIRSLLYSHVGYNFTPPDILSLSDTTFREIGIKNDKLITIHQVAQYWKKEITHSPTIQQIRNLQNIKGIGIWTVECLLIEYGIDLDLFPPNDKYVNRKLTELYGNQGEDKIKSWQPYRSIAFWYLWKYQLA